MNKKILILPIALLLVACGTSGSSKTESSSSSSRKEETSSKISSKSESNSSTQTHAGTYADPLTPAEAVAMMAEAGEGVIVDNKEYFVKGVFEESTVNAQYHQWYGFLSNTTFQVSGASNDSGVTVSETDGAMDGKEVIVKGYLELYQGDYKMGYLPAAASPTGSKYVPSIVWIDGEGSGGGSSSSSSSKPSSSYSSTVKPQSGVFANDNCSDNGSIPESAKSLTLVFSNNDFTEIPHSTTNKANTGSVTVKGITYNYVNCAYHEKDNNSTAPYFAMYAKEAKSVASFGNKTAIPGKIVAIDLVATDATTVSNLAVVSCDLGTSELTGTTSASSGATGASQGSIFTAYANEGFEGSFFRISVLQGVNGKGEAAWYNMMVGSIVIHYVED